MTEIINDLSVCLTSDSYQEFVDMLRSVALWCEDKSERFNLRRAAGTLENHFTADFLDAKYDTKGLDRHGLIPVNAIADVEIKNKSVSIDLLIICDDGNGYNIQEVRGIHKIFSPQELSERAMKSRRYNNEHS